MNARSFPLILNNQIVAVVQGFKESEPKGIRRFTDSKSESKELERLNDKNDENLKIWCIFNFY